MLKEISEKELRKKIAKYKDIFRIPKRYKLSEEIMEEIAKEIAEKQNTPTSKYRWRTEKNWWFEFTLYQDLAEDFILKHEEHMDWDYVFRYQNVSEQFIFNYRYKARWFWNMLSGNKHLSVEFLEKYQEHLIWSLVSSSYPLTEELIERLTHLLDWDLAMEKTSVSEEFILKHQEKINWTYLLKNKHLAKDFFERNKDKLWVKLYAKDLAKIIQFQTLSEETLQEMKKGKMVWRAISSNYDMSRDFLINNYENISPSYLIWYNNNVDEDLKSEVKLIEKMSGN
jgi:hypothetical protein